VDFTYTDDQKMLKDAARKFLAKACPNVEWHLQMEKDDKGYSSELWSGMAELGWMGLPFPEKYGGIGGNLVDLVVLIEEMGYAALPGPYFSTVILGGLALLDAGHEDQKKEFLPKIAEGKLVTTLALAEPATKQFNPALISLRAEAAGADYELDGVKIFVPDANVSDWMIVAARTQGTDADQVGITLFLVESKSPGIRMTPLKSVAGDRQAEVVFEKVKVPKANILGGLNKGWPYLEKVLKKAAVAKCAEMLGGSNKVMEMAVAYAKERVQFGKPIGMFQAVQHLCANMKMSVEQSIYITYKAAWMIDKNMPEAKKFAAIAKTWVSEASKRVALIGHQIFGGTGYIVEHAMPIYSRRAKAGEYAFGNPNYQREILAQELSL
jgi:alkylation response protein AidB-like acyl-CoA dehydrogenase